MMTAIGYTIDLRVIDAPSMDDLRRLFKASVFIEAGRSISAALEQGLRADAVQAAVRAEFDWRRFRKRWSIGFRPKGVNGACPG